MRWTGSRIGRLGAVALFAMVTAGVTIMVGEARAATEAVTIPIALVKAERDRLLPISRLNIVPDDAGLRGAELATTDNNTTGRFTKQSFSLKRYDLPKSGDAAALIEQIANDGIGFVLVDASAERLLALADAARGKPMLLFNLEARESEAARRGLPRQCRPYRAQPGDADRRAGAIPGLEAMDALAADLGRQR